jgi:hypothetical protein
MSFSVSSPRDPDESAELPPALVAAMTAFARAEASAVAGKAAMICALYEALLAREAAESAAGGWEPDEAAVDLGVTAEVALALGVSPRAAEGLVWFARDLGEHPVLAASLSAGRIDQSQAQTILTELRVLPGAQSRSAVVARFVGPVPGEPDRPLVRELCRPGADLWQVPVGRLRAVVAREVHTEDAEAVRKAAEAARARRRVWQRPVEHSMGELTLRAAAEQTTACWSSLDHAARSAKAAGDPRSLDQLRADIAVGRLTLGVFGERGPCSGRDPDRALGPDRDPDPDRDRPRVLVNLTMAVETHLGLDDRPAVLHSDAAGPIPLPADVARALARDPDRAFLRRVLTAPATGVAWDVSGRYRPPSGMSDFVAARDGYRSRLPVSGATRIETDHVVAYDHARPALGGPTTPPNLESLGRRDHRCKTLGRLRITGNANDVLEIRTPAGRRYLSYPEPYHDPIAPGP